jgi:hypothetical protein
MRKPVRDAILLKRSILQKQKRVGCKLPTPLPPATVFSRKLLALAEAPLVINDGPGFFFVDRSRD